MALAGKDGLAGKVVEVRPDRSQALLLIHPDCAVSVRIERSRVAGIAEWSPGSFNTLKLRNISYLADVQLGDRVITSGLGGVYPEGIPVGTITSVKRDDTGLLLDIDVKSAIDFRSLEEIFALRGAEGGAPRSTADGGEPAPPELNRGPVVPFHRPLPALDPHRPSNQAPGATDRGRVWRRPTETTTLWRRPVRLRSGAAPRSCSPGWSWGAGDRGPGHLPVDAVRGQAASSSAVCTSPATGRDPARSSGS
jgi:preprotein translocase subunit YajC